jgi:hypothetical protein
MRVAVIYIPRGGGSLAQAIIETTWNNWRSNLFTDQLNEVAQKLQKPFSLEIYSTGATVYMCVAGEEDTVKAITSGIYIWLPDAEIREIDDYTESVTENALVAGADMRLEWPDIYPFQTALALLWDSMAPVVTALSRIVEGDKMVIQVLAKAIPDSYAHQAKLAVARNIDRIARLFRTRTWLKRDLNLKSAELVKDKCLKRHFRVNYRISSFTELPDKPSRIEVAEAKARLTQNIIHVSNAVKIFNSTDENKFKLDRISYGKSALLKMQERRFDRPFMCMPVELSTLWHPPTLGTLPNTAMVLSRKAPPPRALPAANSDPQICMFGMTNYRDHAVPFGIRRFDRRRHLYALGKSGNGKSCLLQLLIRNDIENGFGCAVLDPHGDLVDDLLKVIPRNRIKDVVVFDPSDVNHPPSFNPMIPIRPELKMRVTLSFLETFKRAIGDAWSEKMDHVLRYAMVALLNIPGTSIVSLRRLLSDDDFRAQVLKRTNDEAVKRFWEVDFANRRQEFEEGPVSQLLNHLDELLATDMIRNILGQPTNTFDFREFIDNRKILLFKVSKGVLGAQNASLIGSLVIWKIYEAAMSRADTPVESRQDFYFYVDEFQNFATDSFGEILSESRKYRLCLTFANQFLGQLPGAVKQTVFGNVSNFIAFRMGSEDAGIVADELKPRFGAEDLLNLPLRQFYIKMSIDGEVQEAFSGRTLDLVNVAQSEETAKACLAHSRANYAIPLAQAEEQLALAEIMSLRVVGEG